MRKQDTTTISTMPAALFDVWARMRAEQHPWMNLVKANADRDATSPLYASYGRWSGIYYLMSGDPHYAQTCYSAFGANYNNWSTLLGTGNATREHGIESTLLLDWTRPALNPNQIATWSDWLTRSIDGTFSYGLRRVDSDQTTGTYFFLAVVDAVLGTDYLTREMRDPGTAEMVPLGGLDATAVDRSTIRNCVNQYVSEMGAGGQWIESWEYNLGTPNLLFMGYLSLLTHHGRDHFPDVTAWLDAARQYHYHEVTPSLTQSFQWGDCQQPHSLHWSSRDTLYAYLRVRSPPFEQFARDMDAANNRSVPTNPKPQYARWFYYADPYAPCDDWQQATLLHHVTPGTGHGYWRSDWTPTAKATHLMCHAFSVGGYVDHWPNAHGHLQIARGGTFVLDYVVSYAPTPQAYNQLLVINSAPSKEAGALTTGASQPGVFSYAAGTNCGMGPDITSSYYYPPPTYLHELTRSVFELLDGDETCIVLVDRVHTDDPRVQLKPDGSPAMDRYPSAAQTRMKNARGLKDLLFHTPVSPTLGDRSFSWVVPNTTLQVDVRQVLPARDLAYTIVDETATNEPLGTVQPQERKFCVHAVAPPDDVLPSFEVFVHVLVAGEGESAITTAPIEAPDVAGVLLGRPSGDVMLLFSAKRGPVVMYNAANLEVVTTARRLQATFAIDVPAATTVYLCDLDPDVAWAATLAGQAIALDWVNDVARLIAPVAGELKLYANETPIPPDPPDPSIPQWMISEQTAGRIVLERVADVRRRKGRP